MPALLITDTGLMAELAKIMIRDCKYDVSIVDDEMLVQLVMKCWFSLNVHLMLPGCFPLQLDEIRQCKDCYHFSNAKPKDWFAQPCVSI